MNGYGNLTQAHWAEWLPQRYAAMPDPEEFFTILGLEIAAEVNAGYQARLSTEPQDLPDHDRESWRAMAHSMAEDEAMADLGFLPPEDPDAELPADPMSALSILTDSMEQSYRDAENEEIEEAEMAYRWRKERGLAT